MATVAIWKVSSSLNQVIKYTTNDEKTDLSNYKDDDKAFIFTLKNPYGVEPTRFMKRKGIEYAIECCDDKGPTLIVIQSSEGWIFGGYTTQSWSGWGIYYDIIY